LTIIGLTVHLSTQNKSKGYFLERILKKSASDLRSFFKELGLVEEVAKRTIRETGEEVDDIFVYFGNSIVKRAKTTPQTDANADQNDNQGEQEEVEAEDDNE